MKIPRKTSQEWETLEQDLYAAGVDLAEVEAGAHRLLAEARGHQLAETRIQHFLAEKDVAARMGVSIAHHAH
ncbi:hypothetical protein ACFO3J_28160 [Streptomyces polygonati]|uniref:Uncharacterized protein n=1 Tax=Streptomyces polygonati TaxID=1617087 RepID=A0ABV8HTN8_9ACTN